LTASDSRQTAGLSDPYCTLSIDRATYKPEKTKTQKKTLDPVWDDEEFWLTVKPEQIETGKICIDISDKDRFNADDAMGAVEIKLNKIPMGKEDRKWRKVVKGLTSSSAVRSDCCVFVFVFLLCAVPRSSPVLRQDATGELDVTVFAADFGKE
jgi:Ca2+-dependent lipid-binding protein